MSGIEEADVLRRARALLATPEDQWLARAQHDVGECIECDAIRIATATALADSRDELARDVFRILMEYRALATGNDAYRAEPADSSVHRELDAWREQADWLLAIYAGNE